MHSELSKREKISLIKLALTILVAAIILISINTILVMFEWNSSITDLIIIITTVVVTYLFIKQNIISYKYCLIEDDFIISEVIGTKEKRILNMNVHQIIKFSSVEDDSYEKDKSSQMASRMKLYNSAESLNKYYIIFEEDHAQRWIIFQPSDYLIELIKKRIAS